MTGSQVTLVVGTNTLAGQVIVPGSHYYYTVRYAGNGTENLYAIDEIDTRLISVDDPPRNPSRGESVQSTVKAKLNNANEAPASPSIQRCGNPFTVDIGELVVYTPRARDYFGGASQTQAQAELGLDYTNTTLCNSKVFVNLSMVGFREVLYDESITSSILVDLERLRTNGDGWMDDVHSWRNMDGRDMVMLVEAGYDPIYAGVADLYDPTDPNRTFAVITVKSLSGAVTAHELGHNMGAFHERTNEPPGPPCPYAYADPQNQFHDLMRGSCANGIPCLMIQNYSNPRVTYCVGTYCGPTGIAAPALDCADAAYEITQHAPLIANRR